MLDFFMWSGIALMIMMLMVLARAIIGPTVIDRLVGVNVIGTKATVLLVIFGILFDRLDMFVDIAIGYGLLNFIASIAAAKYFEKHSTLFAEDKPEKGANL